MKKFAALVLAVAFTAAVGCDKGATATTKVTTSPGTAASAK